MGGLVNNPRPLRIGIDNLLEWQGPDGAVITLNDRSSFNQYRLTSIDGLDTADPRLPSTPAADRHGEVAHKGLSGGRTITMEGVIQAQNLDDLRDMTGALNRAFASLTSEGNLVFRTRNGNDCFISCMRQQFQIKDTQDKAYFTRTFSLTLRASDPRFYGLVEYAHLLLQGKTSVDTPLYNDGSASSPTRIEVTAIGVTVPFVKVIKNIGDVGRTALASIVFQNMPATHTTTFDMRTRRATCRYGDTHGWGFLATEQVGPGNPATPGNDWHLTTTEEQVWMSPGASHLYFQASYTDASSVVHNFDANVIVYWRDAWW
jgi:hypothetical protein